ncbi:hypothetical protein H2199_005406 [Coniosporium tulheliwenetii]|uniref:Uncharacterized protein n=1 Tax=Coniosporium tulheliwenetii TaxID=3383036 RepID=A0ACC2Z1Q6_9PEZI|nr:hypothetical protein H2199_005406 [Cladosporium sp. JES 115]
MFRLLPSSFGFIEYKDAVGVPEITEIKLMNGFGFIEYKRAETVRGTNPSRSGFISALIPTSQVGDLGGKHGNITSGSFHAAYTDLYASLVPGLGSFFGNRSVVVHFANTMRKRYSRPLLAPHNIRTLAWNPLGTLVATGAGDRTLRIWNPERSQVRNSTELRGHVGAVERVAWNRQLPYSGMSACSLA